MSRPVGFPLKTIDVASEIAGNQHFALNVIRQMRRLGEFDNHGLDARPADSHFTTPVAGGSFDADHARQQLRDSRAVAFNKRLAPSCRMRFPMGCHRHWYGEIHAAAAALVADATNRVRPVG